MNSARQMCPPLLQLTPGKVVNVMNATELARRIDHTILKPQATRAEVERIVSEARQWGFASVCVQPIWCRMVAGLLAGTGVETCTVAGFPHGANKPLIKAVEASQAIKDGATEVDVVAHLPYLASGDLASAKAELVEVVRSARATRADVIVKVIVESAYLMSLGEPQAERAIEVACSAVRESGCDYIKTSTGYLPAGGATVEAVRLMKKYGQGLKIKAAGGIRDLRTALAMVEAGADRLGMSASVAVMKELSQRA